MIDIYGLKRVIKKRANGFYRMVVLLVTAALSLLAPASSALKFNNYYTDGMMLQHGVKTKLWGTGNLPADAQFEVTCVLKEKRFSENYTPVQESGNTWFVAIERSMSPQTRCDVKIGDALTLRNALFGDVWICSGQSNMEQSMTNILNGSAEIEASRVFGDQIRYTMVENQVLNVPNDDFDQVMKFNWAKADEPSFLKDMSAVCFMYARQVYDVTGIPQGLVSADWGGTPVEAWSTKSALENCGLPTDVVNPDFPSWSSSYLWNGMVNSLKRNAVKGFLWYQGEANVNYNRDIYDCSFPAMIEAWRAEFSKNSPTSTTAPFGFVQLAPWRPDTMDAGYPVIRWHQTADYGYVPNERMEKVFMSTALDTFDAKQEGYPGGIHPRNKQVVAARLALAGLAVAYELKSYPTNGPFPSIISLAVSKGGEEVLVVEFDQDLIYNYGAEISGFYFCPRRPEECDLGATVDSWLQVPQGLVVQLDSKTLVIDMASFEGVAQGSLGYIWRESPVKETLGLPIYADDKYGLPGAPWKFSTLQGKISQST